MSTDQENIVGLKKELHAESKKKKRYQGLFIVSAIALALFLGMVYDRTVLDYAVIDNVDIQRQGESREVVLRFDVVEPGRLDFTYWTAILSDTTTVQRQAKIRWEWQASGNTEIAIRSRKWFLPYWNTEEIAF